MSGIGIGLGGGGGGGDSGGSTPPISNVCFPAKTPILCDQGIIHIDKINPAIHTIRNKKIIYITKTITQEKHLICFEKDALGPNIPSQKTIITKNHILFISRNNTLQPFRAHTFIGLNDKIYKKKYKKELLYNVLMKITIK